jgi:hypothetical protein
MRHKVASAMAAVAIPVTVALTATQALAATPTLSARAALNSTITLTVADNGRHVRVHRGEHITVQLSVDPSRNPDPTTWWRPIDQDGRALRARPQTLLPVRGTTLGRYTAVTRGKATLSSARAVCPQTSNGPTCHAMQRWSITVYVR